MAIRPTHKFHLFNIRGDLLACIFLILATLAVYWQVRNYGFVNFDDNFYVTENPNVQGGLTLKGIGWAFSFTHKGDRWHWHPLTWLSHMLDCRIYGLRPGMHHLTNLIFHIASSLLLFFVLRRMTGALWRSAFVAALFALHPVNVDSVAWIAQRKNVLSAFFWMLTIVTYIYYLKRPGVLRYLVLFMVFALGLLAKPMPVTLPFVLLLLDYWPLGRIRFGRLREQEGNFLRLVLEKVPLFILSGVLICLDSLSQARYGVVIPTDAVPIKLRLANALVSYVNYIGKMAWPQDLAVFYPYPTMMLPMWEVATSGFFLVMVTVLALCTLRREPYFGVGWFWFIGTLVPTIGLMQVGLWPAMADRWAYVPCIGLFIIIAWGVPALVARWRYRNIVLATIGTVLISFFMATTWIQAGYWKNSTTLFKHALDVTSGNYLAHDNLGTALYHKGKIDEAIRHYREAVKINPNYLEPHNNMGVALFRKGRIDEAIRQYYEALRIKPDLEETHNNLGVALFRKGKTDEAIAHFREALRIRPDYKSARDNLRIVLAAPR